MTKRKSAPLMPSIPHLIGLDVGYGVTKAINSEGKMAVFPSVAGYGKEVNYQQDNLVQRYPGDQLYTPEGLWFIGDLALMQIPTDELIQLRGRTANEASQGHAFRVQMTCAALGKLYPGVANGDTIHFILSTGLPVDHMWDAAGLKSALIGQHPVQTDQTNFIANIVDVIVMPQPYGTIYSQALLPDGNLNDLYHYNTTGVVDIGTYTVDITWDENMVPAPARSGSAEAGMFTVHRTLSEAYNKNHRQKPRQQTIEQIIQNGYAVVNGQKVDYTEEIKHAFTPLQSTTLTLMNSKWGLATELEIIYLTGGPASHSFRALKANYPQVELVPESQLANARGFLYYLKWRTVNSG